MKKNFVIVALSGALICMACAPAMAAQDPIPVPISAPVMEESQQLPDSVLYYGQVKEIRKAEDGTLSQLLLTSDRYGEYMMNISSETVWIDSGNQCADDPSDLKVGERVYIFHSPVETRSLPAQSAAFAVVRNIPQDVGCAQYHEVEAVAEEDGQLKITTSNGGLFILADEKTKLSSYNADKDVSPDNIKAGDHVMAWYEAYAAVYPGQTHANHLMLLDTAETQPLTRAGLVTLLYNAAGNPVVEYEIDYNDVTDSDTYAEAIRWASSEGFISGYGNGSFGPNDAISREQLVTILWRYSGSPMLMDYPGLTQFSDVGEISRFAQQAMAWAHQKKLISATEDGILNPQGTATLEEAEQMLALLKA